jgi:hypothetical protein
VLDQACRIHCSTLTTKQRKDKVRGHFLFLLTRLYSFMSCSVLPVLHFHFFSSPFKLTLSQYSPNIYYSYGHFLIYFFLLPPAFQTIAKCDYQLHYVFPSLRPSFSLPLCQSASLHGTTRFPLDRFSLNYIFQDFSKSYRDNSSVTKI